MKKNIVNILMLIGVFCIMGKASAAQAEAYSAALSGSEEIPPVTTSMTGSVFVTPNVQGNQLSYTLNVHNGVNVTTAHLHCAIRGENGPIIAFLFGKGGNSRVSGDLTVTGTPLTLESTSMQCSKPINTIADLIQAMKDGTIYANVHTDTHESGEIRGQLSQSNPSIPSGSPESLLDIRQFVEQIKSQNQQLHQQIRQNTQALINQLHIH